jgi:aminopeptidase N
MHRFIQITGTLALTLTVSAMLPLLAQTDAPPPILSQEERRALLIGPKTDAVGVRPPVPARPEAVAAQEDYDVTSYLLDLSFDDVERTVSGTVIVTATSLVDGLQHVPLDLLDDMIVSSVTRSATLLGFTHAGDVLDVVLDQPFDDGQSFEIRVAYSGSPLGGGFGTFGWNKYYSGGYGEMVWSLSEPEGARYWWPCKDRPDDKALVEEWWTVRSDWTATGNGVLLGVDPVAPGRSRYRWRSTHPLTTYLVSIAATDYSTFSDTYTTLDGGSMPIDHYVYANDVANAQVSFAATPDMVEFYAQTFGEYPFVEDKYGMSAFPFWGAMEHTANTSYGYGLITGDNTYDYIVAHEAAHQWCGNSVSPRTWADIWLNEGLASHAEALWAEHLGGMPAYHAYMASMYSPSFDGPLYDPDILFSATTYDKGAWIQHMLRHVLGDEAFFLSQRAWYANNKDGVGDTALYQATLESFHGAALDWFFEKWVYGANMPDYEYGFSSADLGDGTYRHYVRIRQVQTNAGVFVMPVDLTLVTGAGNELRTVWNDTADQDFVLDTSAPLVNLLFDNDDWILKVSADLIPLSDADSDGVPDRNDNCPATANPTQADFDGDSLGDACDGDDDGDLLDDEFDCAPLDAEQGEPEEVALLTLVGSAGPSATLSWTAAARADTYDVSRGLLGELSAGYGACIEPELPALTYDDPDLPPSGDGFHYLVRGRDAGCGGGGPTGADSTGTPRPSPCP